MGNSHTNWLHAAILVTLVFAALQWMVTGWNTVNADGTYYAVSAELFARQFWAGDLYPRILYDADSGATSPAFIAHSPFPAYIIASIYPLVGAFVNQMELYFVGLGIAMMFCALASYLWMREYVDTQKAALATFCAAVMPFKLIALYVQSNMAFLVALGVLALMMKCTARLIHKNSRNAGTDYLAFMLALAVLILTHVPTLIAAGAVPLCYALVAWALKHTKMSTFFLLLLAYPLAFGITAFYWWPTLSSASWMSLDEAKHVISFTANFNSWVLPVVLITLWGALLRLRAGDVLKKAEAVRPDDVVLVTAIICILGALFMMSPLSRFLWEHIRILDYAQMPFRFHAIPALFFAPLSLVVLELATIRRMWIWAVGLACAGILISSLYEIPRITHPDISRVRAVSIVLPPRDVFRTADTPAAAYTPELRLKWADMPALWFEAEYTKNTATVTRESINSWRIHANIATAQAHLIIKKYYLPNMQLHDEAGNVLPLGPDVHGFTRIALTRGQHVVQISYARISEQQQANWLSLSVLLLCVVMTWLRQMWLRPRMA